MKKLISVLLMSSILMSLASCAGSTSAPGAASNASNAASSAGTTTPPAASGDKIVVKIAHVEAEDRSTHKACLQLKQELEEKSNGRFTLEIYPNAQLGGDVQLTESAAMGTIQIALPATSVLTMYSEEFGLLDMPFLFNSAESAFAALDGDIGARLNEKISSVGVTCLGYTYNGPRCMTNSKQPINTPEDLKGLKVRVMESPVFIDLFQTLGANATPMSFSELFTGLQQKTVDAQENPPSLIYASRFQEVQKYLSLTNHVHNCLSVLVNSNWYNTLAPDDKIIFDECIHNFVLTQRKMELEDNSTYIKKLEEDGMQVNEISPENQQKFVEALKPMYEKYEKQFGKELFDLARSYNK